MKHKFYIFCASLILAGAGLRLWRNSEAKKPLNRWAPVDDVILLEHGWSGPDEIAYTVSGRHLDSVYLLCMGWYREVQSETIIGERKVSVVPLVHDKRLRSYLRGYQPGDFAVTPLHMHVVENEVENHQMEVSLIVNGIKMMTASGRIYQNPFVTKYDFSRRPRETMRLNQKPPNEVGVIGFNQYMYIFENEAFIFEVLLCNAEFLRKFVESGELKFLTVSGNREERLQTPITRYIPMFTLPD